MLVACIAALDEAPTIGGLVESLRHLGFRVIVVSDGSTDGTARVAGAAGAEVIMHTQRLGIGPSLAEAWRAAYEMGAGRLVQLDAGLSHSPADALRLLKRLDEGADLVVGSRFMRGSCYMGHRPRRLASLAMTAFCNLAQPSYPRLTDWTSGYRAMGRLALAALSRRHWGARMHGWQIEVLAWARAHGLTVAEAPIVYYSGRSSLDWAVALEAVRVAARTATSNWRAPR